MHKQLILLGLLLAGPMSGYRLHVVAAAHGELYRDLKKPNLYYLLSRMENAGLLRVKVEPGARGPRRERLVYTITAAGRRQFLRLLRQALEEYEPIHMGVEVAAVLLDHLPAGEASKLLRNRLEAVRAHRELVTAQVGQADPGTAADHVLLLIEAELAWLDRAVARLESGRVPANRATSHSDGKGPSTAPKRGQSVRRRPTRL